MRDVDEDRPVRRNRQLTKLAVELGVEVRELFDEPKSRVVRPGRPPKAT